MVRLGGTLSSLAIAMVATLVVPMLMTVQADGLIVDPIIDHDPDACPVDDTFIAQPLADPTEPWSLRTLHLAVAVHPSFQDYAGDDWLEEITAVINAGSAWYEQQLKIRILVVHVEALAPDDLTATFQSDGLQILDDLAGLYKTRHANLDRDAVLLVFGKNVAGGLVGAAMCLGGILNPMDHGYMFMEAHEIDTWRTQGRFPQPIDDSATKTFVHELGHLLAAQHRNSNCVETATTYTLPPKGAQACTIMTPHLGLLRLELGTLNRLQMRGWAEYAGL